MCWIKVDLAELIAFKASERSTLFLPYFSSHFVYMCNWRIGFRNVFIVQLNTQTHVTVIGEQQYDS